jgi:hypothetical protein
MVLRVRPKAEQYGPDTVFNEFPGLQHSSLMPPRKRTGQELLSAPGTLVLECRRYLQHRRKNRPVEHFFQSVGRGSNGANRSRWLPNPRHQNEQQPCIGNPSLCYRSGPMPPKGDVSVSIYSFLYGSDRTPEIRSVVGPPGLEPGTSGL